MYRRKTQSLLSFERSSSTVFPLLNCKPTATNGTEHPNAIHYNRISSKSFAKIYVVL